MQAQAFTRERKLEVAQRSHKLLTEKFGIHAENIIFDPLVFPCATGDENYIGGAVETIEGIRLVKQNIPHVRTVLGISNVSFGLPAGAREVVNSVFLYHCTKAGLDLAIVNAERIERFGSIPERERKLAEDLLFNKPPSGGSGRRAECGTATWRACGLAFANEGAEGGDQSISHRRDCGAFPRNRSAQERARGRFAAGPAPGELHHRRIEGRAGGRSESQTGGEGARRLDVINGPLMAGMGEVGRLFNNNELIVAEVSAIGGSHEGRRGPSGAIHGEGGHGKARESDAGDGEGRRARHREESGRDNFEK